MADLTALHEGLAGVALAGRALAEVLGGDHRHRAAGHAGTRRRSITLIRGDKAFTAAYDGQMAMDADELECQRGYGPCVDAGRAGQMMRIDDMGTEERWPDYAQEVAAHGVGSSLSMPLPFQAGHDGGLNTYAGRPHAFSEEDVAVCERRSPRSSPAWPIASAGASAADEAAHMGPR